jgi:hypothetical protein
MVKEEENASEKEANEDVIEKEDDENIKASSPYREDAETRRSLTGCTITLRANHNGIQ